MSQLSQNEFLILLEDKRGNYVPVETPFSEMELKFWSSCLCTFLPELNKFDAGYGKCSYRPNICYIEVIIFI